MCWIETLLLSILIYPFWLIGDNMISRQELTPSCNRRSCQSTGQTCWQSPPLGRSSSWYLSGYFIIVISEWIFHHGDIWVDINFTPTLIMSPSFPKYWRKSFWMFYSLIFMSLGWAAGRILLSYLETKLLCSMETSSEIIMATKEDSLLVWCFISEFSLTKG